MYDVTALSVMLKIYLLLSIIAYSEGFSFSELLYVFTCMFVYIKVLSH